MESSAYNITIPGFFKSLEKTEFLVSPSQQHLIRVALDQIAIAEYVVFQHTCRC